MNLKSVLYLDDTRVPTIIGITRVKNYDEFVEYLTNNPVPELISFDHDLAFEHYPLSEDRPGKDIPYDSYEEKTGLDCAKWVIEHKIPIKHWHVHSFNVVGKMNIERALRSYCPKGELVNLNIPYVSEDWEKVSKGIRIDKRSAPIV
jgi:hypothetical protein